MSNPRVSNSASCLIIISPQSLFQCPSVFTLDQYGIDPCRPIIPNEQNFDLDKSRQKFYHRLKEHHKIVIFRGFVAKYCKMRII